MDHIIIIEGMELQELVAQLTMGNRPPRSLRVTVDGDTVKFKINQYMWSPPMGKKDKGY